MDLVVAVIISMAATCAASLVIHNAKQAAQPYQIRRYRQTYAGKWELPAPGVNLELYSRVKTLLDTLEQERNEARQERDAALQKLIESGDEIDRLGDKLISAKSILNGWDRSDVKINVRERPQKESQKESQKNATIF